MQSALFETGAVCQEQCPLATPFTPGQPQGAFWNYWAPQNTVEGIKKNEKISDLSHSTSVHGTIVEIAIYLIQFDLTQTTFDNIYRFKKLIKSLSFLFQHSMLQSRYKLIFIESYQGLSNTNIKKKKRKIQNVSGFSALIN